MNIGHNNQLGYIEKTTYKQININNYTSIMITNLQYEYNWKKVNLTMDLYTDADIHKKCITMKKSTEMQLHVHAKRIT